MSIIGAILDIAGTVTKEAIAAKQGDTIKLLKKDRDTWQQRAVTWENEVESLKRELSMAHTTIDSLQTDLKKSRDDGNKARRERDEYHMQVIGTSFKAAPIDPDGSYGEEGEEE